MALIVNPETGELEQFGEPAVGRWMRPRTLLVFDDFIPATGAFYTSRELNRELAWCERFVLQAVVDQVTGTSPVLTVTYEHSANERNFSQRKPIFQNEILTAPLTVGGTTDIRSAGDGSGPRPGHQAGRFRLGLGGTSPQAHVRLWVTMRPYV